jgi:hypothetical protein
MLTMRPTGSEPPRNSRPKRRLTTVLSTLLKKAVEWNELDRLPCTITLLRNPKKTMGFHDFEEYERLLAAAQRAAPRRS